MTSTILSSQQELDRLASLRDFDILDSFPEQGFNDIAELAALICGTRCAQVNFIAEDRQWSKASVGIPAAEAPRNFSFCAHVLATGVPLVVPDTGEDARFADHPFVQGDPHIRCYVGAPIIDSRGHVLGAVCVFDGECRVIGDRQLAALQALARQVVTLLEQRRSMLQQQQIADQKLQSEQDTLQQTAERLRLSQLAGKIAYWDWDLATNEFVWSGGSEWVYGRPASEVRTLAQITALLHADDVEEAVHAHRPLVDGKGEYRSEFRVWWPDGSLHWLLAFGQAVFGPDGVPTRVVGMNLRTASRQKKISSAARRWPRSAG